MEYQVFVKEAYDTKVYITIMENTWTNSNQIEAEFVKFSIDLSVFFFLYFFIVTVPHFFE